MSPVRGGTGAHVATGRTRTGMVPYLGVGV